MNFQNTSISEITRFWNCLPSKRRRQFYFLFFLMVIASFFEALTLSAVLPFLSIMTEPKIFFGSSTFKHLPDFIKSADLNLALLFAALFFAVAVLISGGLRLTLLWFNNRVSQLNGSDISLTVYRWALNQPYSCHLSLSSSHLIDSITNKTSTASNAINLFLNLLSAAFIIISILVTLILINLKVALLIFLFFGGAYISIAIYARNKLQKFGLVISDSSGQILKSLQEGLGGIRDIILDNRQAFYCSLYQEVVLPNRITQGKIAFISLAPRWVLESLGICFIVFLAYTFSHSLGMAGSLTVLGVFAMGAQRMLPALQQVYGAWAGIQASRASLVEILEILEAPKIGEETSTQKSISFQKLIIVKDIWFRYSDQAPWVLNGVSLTITKGDCIGFVGKTGSGKSTLTDIVMGLLQPTRGSISVDNQQLDASIIRSWQSHIAHVPQSIYLTDATLIENVAFGISLNEIDEKLAIQILKDVQLWELVEALPDGLYSKIGERGIRLSGGQRQRIGIARALYKQSEIIIFDEATSALDSDTENSVMNVLYSLKKRKTILIIAHRLTSLRGCNKIAKLNKGIIEEITTYEEFIKRS